MGKRRARWLLLLLAFGFLIAAFFAASKAWPAAGFFLCGGGWYWLSRRKARELDSPRTR